MSIDRAKIDKIILSNLALATDILYDYRAFYAGIFVLEEQNVPEYAAALREIEASYAKLCKRTLVLERNPAFSSTRNDPSFTKISRRIQLFPMEVARTIMNHSYVPTD